ncbi:MAG: CPBP family glutamic-type intramembrane protease [Planctomycetes bacterium]|nr:CPBP family glutamic-type intramembrane protease [Planctomycetota bacterium]
MNGADVALVFRREALEILRDRRTLLAGVLLPVLLYPLLFFGTERVRRAAKRSLEGREVAIAFSPGAEEARAAIEPRLEGRVCRLVSGSFDDADVSEGGVHAIVEVRPDPRTVVVRFRSNVELSAEAASRVSGAVEEWREEERLSRLAGAGLVPDPGAPFGFVSLDAAPPERAGGALLGRLLPLVLITVVISAGSFAALDAFAGERERGTLETLLVHPVSSVDLATGKYLAILATALGSSLLNLASLSATLLLAGGLGGERAGNLRLAPGSIAGALLLLVPTAALLAGLLAEVSARARSFREGQNYILPLVLASMIPGIAALLPGVVLDPFLALLPIAGPALALREVLKGSAATLPVAIAVASTFVYAGLLVRRVGGLLDAERILREEAPERATPGAGLHARSTLVATGGTFLVVFALGFPAQARDPIGGLLATLFGIVLPAAFLVARAARVRPGEAFGFLPFRPSHLLAGASLVPAASLLSAFVLAFQQSFLPVPEALAKEMAEKLQIGTLPTLVAFLLYAASPGVCEEMLFRGAVLRGLRRDLPRFRAVLLSSVLFAAFHFSFYRFFPQAALGVLLGFLTLRAGSLWPAIVLHAGHNALVLFAGDEVAILAFDPRFLLAAALGAAAAFWIVRRPRPR